MKISGIHITSERKKSEALLAIWELPENGRFEVTITETAKSRTDSQNNSLHLYLRKMADKFVESGIDQAMAVSKFKAGFSIPVTEYFLKEVFQQVAKDMTGISRTSALSTVQMQQVYEAYNSAMANKFGISGEWPSKINKEELE